MKAFFTILKFALLAALLIGLAFGYIFFRVWQKNERPTIESNSWDKEQILLGHDATLRVSITAPWHREITRPTPFAHPEFLAPVPGEATIKKGSLNLKGKRTWELRVPFVATDTKSLKGLTATFPLKTPKRISPNSVTLTLPPLSIVTPDEIPENPHNPEAFLTEEKPKEKPKKNSEEKAETKRWYWVLAALLFIPAIIYLLRRTGVLKTTPPWEKALSKLDQLDPTTQPVTFYSKLTDILKQYTSERFSVRGRSKTSAEFIQILRNHPQIPKDNLDDLSSFANLADAVKFADHTPNDTEAQTSLDLIRSFVTATTPEPNTDTSDV